MTIKTATFLLSIQLKRVAPLKPANIAQKLPPNFRETYNKPVEYKCAQTRPCLTMVFCKDSQTILLKPQVVFCKDKTKTKLIYV